jgi:vibriolysin
MGSTPRHSSVVLVVGLTAMTFLATACGGSDQPPAEVVTEPIRHMEINRTLAGADFGPSSVGYVLDTGTAIGLGLSSGDDYAVVSETTTPGLRHIRLQQTYQGLPVFGSVLVAHADDTTYLGFNGTVTRHLEGFDITTTVRADEAIDIARADQAGGASVPTANEDSRLVILPDRDGVGARTAWQVTFYAAASARTESGEWSYFVDGTDGTVLWGWNDLQTLDQASGPGGNAKVSRTWDSELDVEPDGGEFKMDTDRFQTLDRADSDEVVVGPLEDIPNAPANDAHGHAETTINMMRYWMNRDSLDDNGFKIVSRVNDMDFCPGAPNNACWSPSQQVMTYGAGGGSQYNRSGALNTVAHELNHGFTDFHSDLTYAGESGGLNESFSDVAGTAAEFYDEGEAADFLHSEDSIMAEAMRYICDPTKDGSSIDHMDDMETDHEVHSSSGVGNKAFCLAVGRYKASEGSNTTTAVRKMGHAWYTANAAYWTASTTYLQGCRGTIDAARALGYENDIVEGIAHSWADVGVECESGTDVCDDDGECDIEDGETCASCSDDCGSCAQDCSYWKKAKCKVGIGDCSQCGDDSGCGDGICDGDEDDSNCGQDCGCAALECEQIAPYGCWCDDACEEFGDCCADREGLCE